MKETALSTMKNDLRRVNFIEMEDFECSFICCDSESDSAFATVYWNPTLQGYDVYHAITNDITGRELDDEKKIGSGLTRFQASNAVKSLQCRIFEMGSTYDGNGTASGAGMDGICDMIRGISARGRSN